MYCRCRFRVPGSGFRVPGSSSGFWVLGSGLAGSLAGSVAPGFLLLDLGRLQPRAPDHFQGVAPSRPVAWSPAVTAWAGFLLMMVNPCLTELSSVAVLLGRPVQRAAGLCARARVVSHVRLKQVPSSNLPSGPNVPLWHRRRNTGSGERLRRYRRSRETGNIYLPGKILPTSK